MAMILAPPVAQTFRLHTHYRYENLLVDSEFKGRAFLRSGIPLGTLEWIPLSMSFFVVSNSLTVPAFSLPPKEIPYHLHPGPHLHPHTDPWHPDPPHLYQPSRKYPHSHQEAT